MRIEIYFTGWILTQLYHIQLEYKPKKLHPNANVERAEIWFQSDFEETTRLDSFFWGIPGLLKNKNCEWEKRFVVVWIDLFILTKRPLSLMNFQLFESSKFSFAKSAVRNSRCGAIQSAFKWQKKNTLQLIHVCC